MSAAGHERADDGSGPASAGAAVGPRVVVADVRPWGGPPADVVTEGGVIRAVVPAGEGAAAAGTAHGETTRIEGRGRLALPGLVNAHAHVDKSWWGRSWEPYGGQATTQGRIAHERAHRDRLGIPSPEVAERVLREFLRHGTTAVRSHVDVDLGVGLEGIAAVQEAVRRLEGAVRVEIVAFPQDGVMRRPGVLDLLDRAAAAGAPLVGGLDPCLIDRDPVAQLDGLFDVAERHGCGLDLHLHAGGELGAFEFELVLDRVRRTGLHGRVTVAHGFALGELPAARQAELVAECAELGVSWTTVAPVGSAPLPWAEMRGAGMALGLGTDGIRDLWSPYGTGSMWRVGLDFARLHRVRHDDDLVAVARLLTSDAAGFVGRAVHDLVPGATADVVLVDAENVPDAVVRAPDRVGVVSHGRLVAEDGALLVPGPTQG